MKMYLDAKEHYESPQDIDRQWQPILMAVEASPAELLEAARPHADLEAAQRIVYLTSRPMKVLRRIPMFGRYYTLERLTSDIVLAALGADDEG